MKETTQRVYFSDVSTEQWFEAPSLKYIIIPNKWWSIKSWKIAIDFSKSIQLYFMKKV